MVHATRMNVDQSLSTVVILCATGLFALVPFDVDNHGSLPDFSRSEVLHTALLLTNLTWKTGMLH